MSLSDQLRPIHRFMFCGVAVCCIAANVGCGSGEEPATGSDGASADPSGDSPPLVAQELPDAAPKPEADATPVSGSMPVGIQNQAAGGSAGVETKAPAATATVAAPPAPVPGIYRMNLGDPDNDGPVFGEPAGSAPQAEQITVKSLRPDAFDAWTEEDFMAAARERDPKLLDAIDFRVKAAPGDASVAGLLTRLLDPPPPPSSSPAPANPGGAAPNSGTTPPQPLEPQTLRENPFKGDFDRGTAALRAVDSVSAIILEACIAYMPQSPGVGAIASGVPGHVEEIAGKASRRKSRSRGDDEPTDENAEGGKSPPNSAGNLQSAKQASDSGDLQDRALVERIVDGLIANNSQDAWQSIFGIVAGTVKTPTPVLTCCEIVVERLIQNMDSNPDVIEPILLTFLDSATPVPPENRTACMRMLIAISATQTGKLTGFVATEQVPAVAAAVPGEIGRIPQPAIGSMRMGGGGDDSIEEDRDDRRAKRADVKVAAVQKQSLPDVSLAPGIVAKGAGFMWSPKAVAAIVSQLEKATDLASASDMILLASTIPVAEVRQAICATLLRLHQSGSDDLNGTGVFTDVNDPGMLVVLKSLPRTRPSKETPGEMDSWTSGTESLVLALRDELKRTSGSMKPYSDTLPVKLHKNAVAEVSVMMQFPSEADEQGESAIPATTQVYYTRAKFTPLKPRDIEDLTKHYEGRTSGYSRPDVAKGVMWIEGVKVLPNGHRRTLDVVIQKGSTGGVQSPVSFSNRDRSGSGSFTIEIVVVDTVDPMNTGSTETAAATAGP